MRAVTVGRPCAEIVVERLTGFKGRFIGCALGAQTADGAGFVVDCFFCAGRGRFQVLFCCCFSREGMRRKVTVFAAAILADCFLRAGGYAAGAIVRFRVACISGADAGVRAVTVGRPCAPVVTEDVAGEEGRFLRRTLGAQAADGAGLVVLRLFRAGCTGLQVLLLGNFCREAVQRKGRLDGHGALGHGERIAVQGEVLRLHHLPAVEVAVRGGRGRQSNLSIRRRACRRCKRGAVTLNLNRNVILLRNEIQLLVASVVFRAGVRIVRGEAALVIAAIGIGERHGIVLVRRGDANPRAVRHSIDDGQRLAGGQIDVVCRTEDSVVSHSGRTTELQLAGIAGIYINSAAAARRVVFDCTAGEIADRAGAVNIDAAAVARGGISADNAAGHIQYGRFAVKVDCTAVHRRVPGDFAAGEVKRGCAVHMHRAALAGRLIAADLAAGHSHRYAIVEIDRAAVLAGRIASELCAGDGDRTACHVDDAAVALRGLIAGDRAAGQVDHTAGCSVDYAAVVCFVAGDCASDQIERAAAGGVNHAAVGRRVVGDKAAVHVHGAAFFVLIVQEDRAAGIFAVVAGNFAAIDVQHTLAVIQCDGAAAALSGDLTAGDLAAENVQCALVEIHAGSAPAVGCALDRAASGAVAEDEPSAAFDCDLIRAVAGEGFSVQAEVERRAVHLQIAVEGDVLRQIHIGRLIGVRNGVCAVPCREHLRGVHGMIPHRSVAAADAVLVEECPVGVERMRRSGGHNCGFLHLRAAVLLGEPAVEAVVDARRRRQRAVGRVGLNEFALFARVQRTAVRVEGDLDSRSGVD